MKPAHPPKLLLKTSLLLEKKAHTGKYCLIALKCLVLPLTTDGCHHLMQSSCSGWTAVRSHLRTDLQKLVHVMTQLIPSFERARFCCRVAEENDGEDRMSPNVEFYMFDAVSQYEFEPHKHVFELSMSSEVEESLDRQPWFELPKACTNIADEFRNQLRKVSLPTLSDSGAIPLCFSRMASSLNRASRLCKRSTTQLHKATASHPIRCHGVPIRGNAMVFSVLWENSRRAITVSEWAKLMAEESKKGILARQVMSNVIKGTPFEGAFFETKGVTIDTAETVAFEFVIINSPSLAKRWQAGADATDFASYFLEENDEDVGDATWFYNLGGDARLVCPQPSPPPDSSSIDSVEQLQSYHGYFAHLLPFLRRATEQQISGLWQLVASQYMAALQERSPQPVWLSTSGEGVAWLHFRLDSTPKYYQFSPFVDGEPWSTLAEEEEDEESEEDDDNGDEDAEMEEATLDDSVGEDSNDSDSSYCEESDYSSD